MHKSRPQKDSSLSLMKHSGKLGRRLRHLQLQTEPLHPLQSRRCNCRRVAGIWQQQHVAAIELFMYSLTPVSVQCHPTSRHIHHIQTPVDCPGVPLLANSILPRWAGSWYQEAGRQDRAGSRRAEGTTADEQVALSSLGRGRGSVHRLVRKVKHGMTSCCLLLVVLVSPDCSLHHDSFWLKRTLPRAQPVICMHHHALFLAESHLPARDGGLRDPGCQ